MASILEIPFAQFTPDGGRLNNPGLLNADNVAPFGASGFVPISAINRIAFTPTDEYFAQILDTGSPQDSISKYAVAGAVTYIPLDEDFYKVFVATMSGISGEEDRCRLIGFQFENSDGSVTGVGGTTIVPGDSIQPEGVFFAVYGDSVVAVGGHDMTPLIFVDASTSTGAAGLISGSPINSIKPKYVAVIGLRLLLGNLNEMGDIKPNRVRWSATDNIRYYGDAATDPDLRTGFQDLHDEYGPITGLVGGTDYAYVAKANCWYRMDFGGPFDFQFKPFAIGHGCRFPHSIVKFGESVYFWGPYGPAVIRGTQDPEPLGLGIFHRSLKDGSWVLESGMGHLASLPPHRMIGFVDAENELIGWAYNAKNDLGEDEEWLWVVDTVFLYNVRYGRGSLLRNLTTTESLGEDGDEEGVSAADLLDDAQLRVDPEGTYPADWRPSFPVAVPRQPSLDGYALWAPLLRVHWVMSTKGYEKFSTPSWFNSFGFTIGYGDNTESPLARFRTGYLPVDAEDGDDGCVKRARLHFSTNVGGEPPAYEVRLYTASNPTVQPTGPIVGNKPNDRGWVTFPRAPNAPFAQFDVRIENPASVGEIEMLEVEVELAGARR